MSFYVQQAKFAMLADGIPRINVENVELTADQLALYVKNAEGFTSLLLLGYVQSGKTNGMIMTLAKLIESGYRHFVILTGNDNELYDQTYERVECTNLGVHLIGKEQLNEVKLSEVDQDSNRIIVFVVQKYGTYLQRLNNIFETTGEPFIVIDDEADQASLDTNKNNTNNDPSIINAHISSILKNDFAKAYIQVTATPYALLLQERDDIFRPKRTFILEPGDGYIGGEELFLKGDSNRYHRTYDITNMIFRDDVGIPNALVDSICNFIIAATLIRLGGFGKSLSFLAHIDHTQITHENTSEAIRYIVTRIHNTVKGYIRTRKETELILKLKTEYEDILRTYQSSVSFDKVIDYLVYSLENVNNQIVNSNYKQEISYNRMYTIIIGGNKLSRGITIKNLITTYYCRNSATPNMDTVNQHARMYGYRAEIKDVMRIFTTSQIVSDFEQITRSDMLLRNYLSDYPDSNIIPINHNTRLRTTRANVVPNNTVLQFTTRKTAFPHYPIYDDDTVEVDTQELDTILCDYNTEKFGHLISIDMACDILNRIRYTSTLNEEWNHEAIIALLRNNAHELHNQIKMIIRRDSEVSHNEERGIASVLSGTDNIIYDDHLPILFLYRLNGHAKDGWADKPFWVPIFRMPSSGGQCITLQCY